MPDTPDDRTVCCLGSMTMDRVLTLQAPGLLGTTNPVAGEKVAGGMALNVAAALAHLSVGCKLIAVVGDDNDGRVVLAEAGRQGIDIGLVQKSLSKPTGSSTAVVDLDGKLFVGFADMAICETMDRGFIQNRWLQIGNAALVFADTSLPADSLAYLLAGCREHGLPLVIDATSTASARKLPLNLHGLELLVCSSDQARAILGDELTGVPGSMASALCQRGADTTVVTADAALSLASADAGTAELRADVAPLSGNDRARLVAGAIQGRLQGQSWQQSLENALVAGT